MSCILHIGRMNEMVSEAEDEMLVRACVCVVVVGLNGGRKYEKN